MIGSVALFAALMAAPALEEQPPPGLQTIEDHHLVGLALGTGHNGPTALAGIELALQPSRHLAFSLGVGFGPSVTNPDFCILFCSDTRVRHVGPTPWRWTASALAFVPLSERVDAQFRLALMRNPGAVHTHVDWLSDGYDEYDEYDDYYDEEMATVERRPMTLSLLATAGIKFRVRGPLFLRTELGLSQVVYEKVPWSEPIADGFDVYHEAVDRSHGAQGLSWSMAFGFDFL